MAHEYEFSYLFEPIVINVTSQAKEDYVKAKALAEALNESRKKDKFSVNSKIIHDNNISLSK